MALAMAEVAPDYEQRLWKLLAFLGRYGHQSVPEVMRSISASDARALAEATADLMKDEAEALRRANTQE